MRDEDIPTQNSDRWSAGLRVSGLSIVWTVATGAVAVALGWRSHSLVLLSFGVTGTLDAVGSALLVSHFRHALHHEAISAEKERVALYVITIGLLSVGLLTAIGSVDRLLTDGHAKTDPAGIVLASASLVVLAMLARGKRQIALSIPSGALLADSRLSATGAALAAITVTGTSLTTLFSWGWVDPVAALVVAGAVTMIAVRGWRAARLVS